MIHHAGRQITDLRMSGRQPVLAMHQGRPILPNTFEVTWPTLEHRIVEDAAGKWFEVGFRSPEILTGNAAAGWTDPHGALKYELQRSENLVDWSLTQFTDCDGNPVETEPGFFDYWARMNVPLWWRNIIVDLSATSNRYGKSIESMTIGGLAVSLPNFPYALPAQAATLQTDLRANGYPGAVVSSVSAALSVEIITHSWSGTSYDRQSLGVTLSGTDVTQVRTNTGTPITLPSYPYAMPAAQATLQADLRTAGQSGAVVKLFADEWTIFLPDRPAATPLQRQMDLIITPSDPHPEWDMFGTVLAENPDNQVSGTSGNVRPGVGESSISESLRAFSRMKITKQA